MNLDELYLDPATRLLNPLRRDLEPEAGALGYSLGLVNAKGIDAAKRRVPATCSTASEDRYGERVLPSAFRDLSHFLRNPKLIAGHVYSTPTGQPTSIGHWEDMRATDEALTGIAQFLPEGDALADAWWFRFAHGAQRSFSVGWLTHKWEMRRVEGTDKYQRVFTEVELIEISAVEIPANRDALIRAASAAGRLMPATLKSQSCEGIADSIIRQLRVELTDPMGPLVALVANALDSRSDPRGQTCTGEHHEDAGHAGLAEIERGLAAALAATQPRK